MCEFGKKFVEMKSQKGELLSVYERELLFEAYKNVIEPKRASWYDS